MVNLHLPLLKPHESTADYDIALIIAPEAVGLLELNNRESKPMFLELLSGPQAYRHRQVSSRQEMILRAIAGKGKVSELNVFDATAGFARDSLIIALAGGRVTLCERNPIVYLLLKDAITRAQGQTEQLDDALARMQYYQSDAIDWFARWDKQKDHPPFDVVYLDPMFPPRSKSAKVKKDMQLLQRLVGENSAGISKDKNREKKEARLLNTALLHAQQRVVVKRSRLAPALAGKDPDFSVKGRSSRFDVYLPRK